LTTSQLCTGRWWADVAQRDVLIVEHEPIHRDLFREIFLAAGYNCLLANDGREGLEVFRGSRPALVFTELNIPVIRGGERVAGAGIELLQQVRQEDPEFCSVPLAYLMHSIRTRVARERRRAQNERGRNPPRPRRNPNRTRPPRKPDG